MKKDKGYPNGPIHLWKYVFRWAEPELITYTTLVALLVGGIVIATWFTR